MGFLQTCARVWFWLSSLSSKSSSILSEGVPDVDPDANAELDSCVYLSTQFAYDDCFKSK